MKPTLMSLGMVTVLLALSARQAAAATTTYEAEDATRTAGVVEANHAGFTGTGFVDYDNAVGSSVRFDVLVATAGQHALVFRFANGTTADRAMAIAVNGTVVDASMSFPGTGAWTSWTTKILRVQLRAGANVIATTATTGNGGPNLDSLVVDTETNVPPPADWSRAVVDSTMARRSATSLGLGYTDALFLYGAHLVYRRTHEPRYLDYIKAWGNARVQADGSTGNAYNDLDSMLAGNIFLILAQETGENRYRLAAARIRQRLDTYPRTTDGGVIHNTNFRGQLWADGVFMAQPFVARYGVQFNDSSYGFNESTRQIITYFNHLKDENGLLHHAYDELRQQSWANPTTGRSPEVWCRAVGWFGVATVDLLEILPAGHQNRTELINIVRHLAELYRQWQDPASGRWFQLPARPTLAGNWTETSCSSMYTYTVARAVQRGYVDSSYSQVVAKGYQGVMEKVSIGSDGRSNIADICTGTSVGDAPYYLNRPRATNEIHGIGPFLIMNEQRLAP